MRADGRTDGHDEDSSRFPQFYERARKLSVSATVCVYVFAQAERQTYRWSARLWDQPSFLFNRYRLLFPWVKRMIKYPRVVFTV
jgi:transposase